MFVVHQPFEGVELVVLGELNRIKRQRREYSSEVDALGHVLLNVECHNCLVSPYTKKHAGLCMSVKEIQGIG